MVRTNRFPGRGAAGAKALSPKPGLHIKGSTVGRVLGGRGLWVGELRDHSSKFPCLHAGALEDKQPVFGVVSTEYQAGLVQSLKFLLRYLFSFVSPFKKKSLKIKARASCPTGRFSTIEQHVPSMTYHVFILG